MASRAFSRGLTRAIAQRPATQSFAATSSLLPQIRCISDSTPRQINPSGRRKIDGSGEYARTDKTYEFEHPPEEEMPSSRPVPGRGGKHFKRTLPQFSLEGKTAVVTGGARGLGLVMAQAIVESGGDVALVDMNHEEAMKQCDALVKHFQDINPKADRESLPIVSAHKCDVSSPEDVERAFQEILKEHDNKVTSLVTSAGFTENFAAQDYPFDRMQKLWGVNVNGTYLWATTLARHLMNNRHDAKGSIVMIGSMSGSIVNVPQPQAPYNAAKAAVRHLAASLAVEWAHAGVRVNCISPGYMLTELTRKILTEKPDLAKKWTDLIPTGKMGVPEDLMGAVVYLLSDASMYVTGADLRVDGGYTVT